ncbi:MAG: metal-dependent transcriptional regulator [Gemmatimonadota bacterium]|jgi:DtxR family Mn-dependent transcriptional regulator
MVDPGVALLGFAVAGAVLALLFWPQRGVVPRVARVFRTSERVELEDALKHLVQCEREGRRVSLESLAGRLEVTRGRAARLVSRLADLGMATADTAVPELTERGRRTALRVLRTHRLWERWLADRTGVDSTEWHAEAERVEHMMSADQTDALSARLGHPRYDPHGDPIPTRAGDLPPRRGVPLAEVPVGRGGVVVHVEDEPPEVYADLVREGFAPHLPIEVLDRESGRVRLRVRGREITLDGVSAGAINVQLLPAGEERSQAHETLAILEQGESAQVTGISAACQGPQRRRLLDLGVVPGTVIRAELVSSSGDPVAYRIRGALIALRREQAAWVEIESLPAGVAGEAGAA